MRTLWRISAATLSLALLASFSTALNSNTARAATDEPQAAAPTFGALERGYRTGYSDGYQSGYSDSVNNRPREFRSKEDYQHADRVYIAAYGSLEDYRDGYQQGFESGYAAGFDRQGFDSTVPTTLRRRGATTTADNPARDTGGRPVIRRDDSNNNRRDDAADANRNDPNRNDPNSPVANTTPAGTFDIPADTNMRIELLNNLSTDVSQRGDNFEARVVEPAQFADAVVTGRVSSVRRPGKVRGSGELQLSFQQIRFTDGRTANFGAQVTEIVNTRTDSDTGEVDPEGGVHGRSTTKDDVTKVGAATGIGAIIGAIAGGGKGAAIGAVIGAGVGTGGVMTSHGKDIRLQRGQQLMIRTSADTRIQ
jgi:hypothetical protein